MNRLLPETKQEKALFEETEARNSLRKSKRGKELENGEVLITKNRVEAMLAEGWIFNSMPSLADRESILMRGNLPRKLSDMPATAQEHAWSSLWKVSDVPGFRIGFLNSLCFCWFGAFLFRS